APPEALGALELVSQGEHLCQTADAIANASSTTQRDLRLYHLLGALRSAGTPSHDPVAGALGIFAKSAQEALAAGVASRSVSELAARLREAGELLRAVGERDDRMVISRRLLDVAYRLDGLRASVPPVAEPPIVPIRSLEYQTEADVVPIGSLAPDAGREVEPAPGIEASFRTLDRLIRDRGSVAPSLERLLVPASTMADTAERVAAPPPVRVPEPEPVAIRSLVYSGQAALQRAVTVRHQIAAELSREADLKSLQPLLQELLDLVPLALEQS
ncbi:MAG TPA: hypothetical protein VJ808_13865, partial [Gemmatimonadales bacterium]|nr:hypothetical protein [Gemmatimonadales bacterium]